MPPEEDCPTDPVGAPGLLAGMGLSADAESLYRQLILEPMPAADTQHLQASVELLRAGLAYRNEDQLTAMPARLAVERWVADQEARIRQVRVGAQQYSALQRNTSGGFLELIRGVDRVRDAFAQLQLAATEQVRSFDREPYFDPPKISEVQPAVAADGVLYRTIYQRNALADPVEMTSIREAIALGEQARSFGELPMRMSISDTTMALLILPYGGTDDTGPVGADAVLIHPSALLDSMVRMFETIWSMSVAIPLSGDDQDAEVESRQLVSLLATGLTGAAIARELGVSERTVQRRIGRLFELLDADSRFSLGAQAARRGWI
ncbi:HTH domain-containing protein [Naumannella halotolerans]|uniref:Regulatory LuxR family protein n=1 Tax=Naumannella halotolerans TaxID=993414 RepID=A0A4R7J217_9ACTN|nr:helix-turn-helix transcriptional regulator [Naumannella halotolerans]TDT31055.1 regulatory LuxR family protein [Naumannella halotolerans]